jgi:hypothetical protein
MSRIGQIEKAGKASLRPSRATFKFSCLSNPPTWRYGVWAMQHDEPIHIRDLYPDLTEEQLREAEANLSRFTTVLLKILERLRAEGDRGNNDDVRERFDSFANDFTIPDERSNFPTNN